VPLRLTTDVVSHFRRPWRCIIDLRPAQAFGVGHEADFGVRQRVEERFLRVLDHFTGSDKPDRIVIIAHSQGTIIAVEALRKAYSVPARGMSASQIALVTMGSPLTHIYQYYFPRQYGPLTDEYWAGLSNLFQWKNLHRPDDYVGTSITAPPDLVKNFLIPKNRGHINYWRDRDVLVHIDRLLK
jgi:hypothetical protein